MGPPHIWIQLNWFSIMGTDQMIRHVFLNLHFNGAVIQEVHATEQCFGKHLPTSAKE